MPTTITREDLYEAVWSDTLKTLATKYDTTHSRLVRACDRLAIPRPKRGHWQLVAMGRAPERPDLPDAPKETPASVTLEPGQRRPRSTRPKANPNADHPLVKATAKAMKSAKPDENGQLQPPRKRRCLALKVTRDSLDRAISIYALVAAELEAAGGKLELRSKEYGLAETVARIDGEEFSLVVKEKLRMTTRPVTEAERKTRFRYMFSDTVREYFPTGKLTLKVLDLSGTGARQTWPDSAAMKVEDKLGSFVPALLEGAERRRQGRIRAAALERERKAAAQVEAERREEQQRQQAIATHTFQMQKHWRAAVELREFVAAASVAVPSDTRSKEFTDWLDFATWYADAIDPLLTPERAMKMLERPNTSLWFSDEDLGLAKRHLPWQYHR